MERRKRRKFTTEFRAEAVRLVREGTQSLPQVAKDLDLTESALRIWVRRAEVAEGKGPTGALSAAEREELVQLRRENRQLQMERECSKNARTWRLAAEAWPVRPQLLRGFAGSLFSSSSLARTSSSRC